VLDREAEKARYIEAYKSDNYYCKPIRREPTFKLMQMVGDADGQSWLDVGCGRGEVIDEAQSKGFSVKGVETVPALIDGVRVIEGDACSLPFPVNGFDVVSCFDVLEHLVPGDEVKALQEFARVAERFVLLSADNKVQPLHINIKPYSEWDKVIKSVFPTAKQVELTSHPHPKFWIAKL